MKNLKHPNIISLYEIIETNKELSIVLELASGGEVLDYIVEKGSLREDEARGLFKQIVSAVGMILVSLICRISSLLGNRA
jgi:serine/threonine protein kinase